MKSFSRKQMELLSWWLPERRTSRYDGIICDGAVRSGKTLCMAISFFAWSMSCFNGQSFALCGKTISGVRRKSSASCSLLLFTMLSVSYCLRYPIIADVSAPIFVYPVSGK